MSIVHGFSNTVADATGTLTVWNGATTASIAATDVVRPSNWNSAHNMVYALGGNTTNASSVSGTDVVIAGMGGVSVGGSNSSLVISGPSQFTASDWEPVPIGNNTSFSSFGQNTLYFQGMHPQINVSMTGIEMTVSLSSATSSVSHSVGQTMSYGWYSKGTGANTSRYESMATSSFIMQASFSSNLSGGMTFGDANTSYTNSSAGTVFGSVLSGQKILSLPMNTILSAGGDYMFCFANSTTSTGNTGALRASYQVLTNMTNGSFGIIANNTVAVSNASISNEPQLVIYSATSGAWPSTIAKSQFSQNSYNQFYVYVEA
jgi:hypothetical protein